jgi:hypothetical protein
MDDTTVEAIAALRRGAAATEIDAIWIEQVEMLEAEIDRLRALPDPRPTEAEARKALTDAGLHDHGVGFHTLQALGCFRPEPADEPPHIVQDGFTVMGLAEPVPAAEPPTTLCPSCGALPGEHCHAPDGGLYVGDPHVARLGAVDE